MRLQRVSVVTINIMVIWYLTQYSLVDMCKRLGRNLLQCIVAMGISVSFQDI
jgi:hypothetical protein